MLYVFIALTIVCAVLGAIGAVQYRRLREQRRVTARLSDAIDSMTRTMRESETTQDFSARTDNPALASCWEINACDRKDCTAYKNPDLRCWLLTGTLCHEINEHNLFAKLEQCMECEVYQRARPDLVTRLREQFNSLMAAMQRKTERLAATKRQIQRANKLASVGELAAGVAHEINNPLDGIRGCVARLERDPANLDQNIEYLHLIHDSLDRMARAVQHLLEYSQKRDLHLATEDIHGVLENVATLTRAAARQKGIEVDYAIEAETPAIIGDPYYLEQAFLNLALNAVAATPEGGVIEFRSRCNGASGKGGEYLEIDVADNGCGIEHANLERVFEPFFTTKEPGKGTGLGLAIVKSIIEEHQGDIMIESEVDEGTTIKVFLPVARSEVHNDPERELSVENSVSGRRTD